ncbi:uncharacterized protein DFL_009027 [Arthrobotrys flagrans]|uniref:Peptidase S8/S53 domain-containing protein n=1 Tax=Arthrobotrys flagrans TaxID=97331 RepID=A0A436ZQU4_ARTFL|nr:hypothetical protein DFL_009027 [Arthrobotrys flagrans]
MSVLIFFFTCCILFSSILGAPPSPNPQELKVGVSMYWRAICIVDKDFREGGNDLFEDLDEGFLDGNLGGWLSPPRGFSLLGIESENLGIWAYGFKLREAQDNPKSYDELLEDLKDDIDAYLNSKGHKWPFDSCEVDLEIDPTANIAQTPSSDNEEQNKNGVDGEGNVDIHGSEPPLRKREQQRKQRHQSSANVGSLRAISSIRPPHKPIRRFTEDDQHLVSSILTKREDDEVVAVENAWEGLPTLSAPRNIEWMLDEKLSKTYFHYKDPGEGVVVYVVDSECDLGHYELLDIKFERWLGSGGPPLEFLTDVEARGEHGSKMIGKIAGKKGGIAQRARIVSLRDKPTGMILIDGDEMTKPLVEILSKLTDLENVILVSTAGNGEPGAPILHYPSRLAVNGPKRRHVVVGGTDVNGLNVYQYDPKIPNFVWAQSEATATVAGTLAMYISRDIESKARLEDAITKLKELSWKRNPEGVPTIHNGVTPDQWPEKFRKLIGTL